MARYRGPSDATVAITGILSGLAAVERQYRYDAREKDRFREAVILQDRKLKYAGEQSRADRDLRKFEFQWKTLTDDKKIALDRLEALDSERSRLGVTDAEWQTIPYMDQSEDFKDIVDKSSEALQGEINSAVFSYTDTDKQITDLMGQVDDINTRIRMSKQLNQRITQLSSELAAELPEFYETYRNTGEHEEGLTELQKMQRSFTIEDDELKKIYGELATVRPDMFGDIDTNEVLQDLIRREISTQYSPALERASKLETMRAQVVNQKTQEESAVTGDYTTLIQSLVAGQNLALESMGQNFKVKMFEPGDAGIHKANKAIKEFAKDFKTIDGIDPAQSQALADLIVAQPGKQYLGFGPIMANAFRTLKSDEASEAEVATAKDVVAALEKHGIYGYMDDESKDEFVKQLEYYYTQNRKLHNTIRQQGDDLYKKLGIQDPVSGAVITPPGDGDDGKEGIDNNALNINKAWQYINKNSNASETDTSTLINPVLPDSSGGIQDTLDALEILDLDSLGQDLSVTAVDTMYNTGDIDSLYTNLPLLGFDEPPPEFLSRYEFAGYTKPSGFMSTGGGQTRYKNKATGEITDVPSEMLALWDDNSPDSLSITAEEMKQFRAYDNKLKSDYGAAAEFRDALQDLEDAGDKLARVKSSYTEEHPRRKMRESQLESEILQIQQSLDAMLLASPKLASIRYHEGA